MPLRQDCSFCKMELRGVPNPGDYSSHTICGICLESDNDKFKPYIYPRGFNKDASFRIYVPHKDGYGRVIIKNIRYCPMCGRKLRFKIDV